MALFYCRTKLVSTKSFHLTWSYIALVKCQYTSLIHNYIYAVLTQLSQQSIVENKRNILNITIDFKLHSAVGTITACIYLPTVAWPLILFMGKLNVRAALLSRSPCPVPASHSFGSCDSISQGENSDLWVYPLINDYLFLDSELVWDSFKRPTAITTQLHSCNIHAEDLGQSMQAVFSVSVNLYEPKLVIPVIFLWCPWPCWLS